MELEFEDDVMGQLDEELIHFDILIETTMYLSTYNLYKKKTPHSYTNKELRRQLHGLFNKINESNLPFQYFQNTF